MGAIGACHQQRISYTRTNPFSKLDSAGYYVYQLEPLNRRQVLFTYVWFASVVAPILIWANFQDALSKLLRDEERAAGLCLFTVAIVLVSPYLLGRHALARKQREWRRQNLGLPAHPIDG